VHTEEGRKKWIHKSKWPKLADAAGATEATKKSGVISLMAEAPKTDEVVQITNVENLRTRSVPVVDG
jgi:hypothetical protein